MNRAEKSHKNSEWNLWTSSIDDRAHFKELEIFRVANKKTHGQKEIEKGICYIYGKERMISVHHSLKTIIHSIAILCATFINSNCISLCSSLFVVRCLFYHLNNIYVKNCALHQFKLDNGYCNEFCLLQIANWGLSFNVYKYVCSSYLNIHWTSDR